MAAKLYGGAYLSSFVDAILDNLSSILEDDDSVLNGNYSALELLPRLEKSLYDVRPVLDDAEQKQFTDKRVEKWLVDLQDALYFADDLLVELSTKTATATQRDPGISSYCSSVVDSYIEGNGDMEYIVQRLESVVARKNYLLLKESAKVDMSSWRTPSTSLVVSSDIFGRDKDKEKIIKLLLDDTVNAESPFTVIPIVGLGGIGKTTLAQLVYNDAEVVKKFDSKAWVCVSENLDPVSLTRIILNKITSSSCNTEDFESLQIDLKEKLVGKMFLVVLDDIWDDRRDIWEDILKPFQYGNNGSKILLTTRSEKVASVFATTNQHHQLDLLSNEDCWSVFCKHSSISINSEQYEILEPIGRKIVKKCKGLPLAVKTLGGLLRHKYNVGDWESILQNEIWELPGKIVPALRVSYHYLPSHLKRCFVYCSLYPEDYQFDKEQLILLWMAEDLVQPIENHTLENIGRAYFDELVAMSFFQPSSTHSSLFVMHDLMHDLASSFSQKFYFRVKDFENPQKICSKTRHFSYITNPRDPILRLGEAYKAAEHMRTFLNVNAHFESNDIENEFLLLLLQMRRLRVLSFQCFSIESLPDPIDKLIHLHYLDLSHTPIVRLSESMCKLYNLQTLKLGFCKKLEMLPSRMQDLVNLRHLDIEETFSLKEMPKGMSNLKHLNLLGRYIVGKHEENGIRELGTLDNLHGSLSISNLENVSNSDEALEAKMGNKKHINILKLEWSSFRDTVDVQTDERDVLKKLQPHRNLKELSIGCYMGEILPNWLGLSCYSNITNLTMYCCMNCHQLPSLGQLPSLQYLHMVGFYELEKIGGEFYKNDESSLQTPFKSLEILRFQYMDSWREWHFPDEFDGFPKLRRLSMEGCPVLTGDLPAHLPALEELTIIGCEKLSSSLPRAPNLQKLFVDGAVSYMTVAEPQEIVISDTELAKFILECLSHVQLPGLQCLTLWGCRSSISISGDYLPASFQYLKIRDCSNLTFSEQLQHQSVMEILVEKCESLTLFPLAALPNLKRLTIARCENMEYVELAEPLPCLGYLRISNCPRLVSFSALGLAVAAPHLEQLELLNCPEMDSYGDDCLPPSLTTLRIDNRQILEKLITSKGSQIQGLTKLILEDWNDVKSFPRDGWLPASLQFLHLSKFPNLETLDCKGLHQLTSLEELTVVECPKLQNITEEKLPASISKLRMKGEFPLRCKLEEMNDPRIQFETDDNTDWEAEECWF